MLQGEWKLAMIMVLLRVTGVFPYLGTFIMDNICCFSSVPEANPSDALRCFADWDLTWLCLDIFGPWAALNLSRTRPVTVGSIPEVFNGWIFASSVSHAQSSTVRASPQNRRLLMRDVSC